MKRHTQHHPAVQLYRIAAATARKAPNGLLRLGAWTACWATEGAGCGHLTISYRGEYSPFEVLDAGTALTAAGITAFREEIGAAHPSLHFEIRAGNPASPAQPYESTDAAGNPTAVLAEIRAPRRITRQVRRLNPEAWAI